MKKKALFMTLFSLLFSQERAFSTGWEFMGLGVKAMSMGGAFIAKADDSSATYWNPAGLAQLEGTEMDVELFTDKIRITDRNSVRNPDPEDVSIHRSDVFFKVYPSEPDNWHDTVPKISFYSFEQAGYWPLGEDYVLGTNYYVPYGVYYDWDDDVKDPLTGATVSADYFNSFFLNVTNLSLARKVTPRLYLGTGINFVYSRFTTDVGKDYFGSSDPSFPDYTYDLEGHAKGIGLEGVFGFIYWLNDKLRVGGVYRTGANVKIRGHTRIEHSPVPGFEGFKESDRFDQNFPMPPTWGLGIAYNLTPKLTFTFDWQGTDWRVQELDIDYDDDEDNLVLKDEHKSMDWTVGYRWRFGSEYRFNEKWAFYLGGMFENMAVPDKAVAITNITSIAMRGISTGVSYQPTDNWRFEVTSFNFWGENDLKNAEDIKDKETLFGMRITYIF